MYMQALFKSQTADPVLFLNPPALASRATLPAPSRTPNRYFRKLRRLLLKPLGQLPVKHRQHACYHALANQSPAAQQEEEEVDDHYAKCNCEEFWGELEEALAQSHVFARRLSRALPAGMPETEHKKQQAPAYGAASCVLVGESSRTHRQSCCWQDQNAQAGKEQTSFDSGGLWSPFYNHNSSNLSSSSLASSIIDDGEASLSSLPQMELVAGAYSGVASSVSLFESARQQGSRQSSSSHYQQQVIRV